MAMILFLKAAITGGADSDLFAQTVMVEGHLRDGQFIAPHMAIRHKRMVQPFPSGQGDLFAGATKPVDFARRLAALKQRRDPDNREPDLFAEPRQELVAEHKRLVAVLRSPSHEDDKAEATKQAAELKEMEAGPQKPAPLDAGWTEVPSQALSKLYVARKAARESLDAATRPLKYMGMRQKDIQATPEVASAQASLDAANSAVAEEEIAIRYCKPSAAQSIRALYGIPESVSIPETYGAGTLRPRDMFLDGSSRHKVNIRWHEGKPTFSEWAWNYGQGSGGYWQVPYRGSKNMGLAALQALLARKVEAPAEAEVAEEPAPQPPAPSGRPSMDGLPDDAELVSGKGAAADKWAVRLGDGSSTPMLATEAEAIAEGIKLAGRQTEAAQRGAASEAKDKDIADRVRAGGEVTDADLAHLGLRADGASRFDYLSPVVQRLFGISRAKVREAMGDTLKPAQGESGETWWANPRRALAAAAAYAAPKVAPAAQAPADAGPKEGDTKSEGGITYRLKDGRWHRQGEPPAPAPAPMVAKPDLAAVAAAAGADVAARTKQAAKLRELADADMAEAEAAMSADRNTNTARRARMAAGAIETAQQRERIAATMRNLADAIESGEAVHLAGVKTRAAVEQLDELARQAKYARARLDGGAAWDKVRDAPITADDIRHATLPRVHVGSYQANGMLAAGQKTRGAISPALARFLSQVGDSQEVPSVPDHLLADFRQAVAKLGTADSSRYGAVGQAREDLKKLDRVLKLGFTSDTKLKQGLAEYMLYRGGARSEDPIKVAERALAGRKDIGVDFFPTPAPLVNQMVQLADIKPGMTVLEPSAGKGDIADAARAAGGAVDVVELSTTLHPILAAKGHRLAGGDFDTFTPPAGGYDRILMNPPFSNGLDAAHVMRAYGMLKPGGRLVAITGEGVHFRTDAKARGFRDWLEENNAEVQKLPEGSFKSAFRPTGVATRLVVLDKPADAAEVAGVAAEAPAAAPVPAPPPAAEEGPREGDTKVKDGTTYVLRDGRWHRAEPEVAAEPKPVPKPIPATVRYAVKNDLAALREVAESLQQGRDTDAKFQGGGRYERDAWENNDAKRQAALERLDRIRAMGVKNGVDVEGLVAELGGQPVVALSPAAEAWGATPAAAEPTAPALDLENPQAQQAEASPASSAAPEASSEPPASPPPAPAAPAWQSDSFETAARKLAGEKPEGFTADDLAAHWKGRNADEALDMLHAHAGQFSLGPDGVTWHRKVTRAAPAADAAPPPDDLDPSSPNYRYRDTGYIAGSRKEAAAEAIRTAARTGQRVRSTDVDWTELEANPREAKALITKANLFGDVDWQAMQAAGVEPGAGFLISRIYAAVGTAPAEDNPEGRRHYAVAMDSLRDRMEACKTPTDVAGLLATIRDERSGVVMNADEAARYAELSEAWTEASREYRALDARSDELSKIASDLATSTRPLEREIEKRQDRGWKVDPAEVAKLEALRVEARAAWQAAADYRQQAGLNAITTSDGNGGVNFTYPARAKMDAISQQRRALTIAVTLRNAVENPMTRAWGALGAGFNAVVDYRSSKGSDAFAKHMATAKAGRIKDWSWAEQKREVKGASKTSTRFQLRVADTHERKGGRPVAADSTVALKASFGLRDVQSGKWVLEDPNSAKFHVEQCAGAFADLADLIGVPDAHVSMNGRLAMGFGARGQGSRTGVAHYESVQRVINITKMAGGGSLAHEWFHFMDNLLREASTGQAGTADDFATENAEGLPPDLQQAVRGLVTSMMAGPHRKVERLEYTASEVKRARMYATGGYGAAAKAIQKASDMQNAVDMLENLHEAGSFGALGKPKTKKNYQDWRRVAIIHFAEKEREAAGEPEPPADKLRTARYFHGPGMSLFLSDATDMDEGVSGKYWSAPKEMAARAFSAWAQDRLAEKGQRNTYLVSMADNEAYRAMGMPHRPFPEKAERERINAAFDTFMAQVRGRGDLAKALALMMAA